MSPIKKKSRTAAPKKRAIRAIGLEGRVKQLEADMHDMRTKMNDLGEDLSALRTTVKHVDERTLRGEGVMMSMQVEQHRMSRVLDLVAEKLEVKAIAQTPKTLDLVPEEEMEDDPEFDEKP